MQKGWRIGYQLLTSYLSIYFQLEFNTSHCLLYLILLPSISGKHNTQHCSYPISLHMLSLVALTLHPASIVFTYKIPRICTHVHTDIHRPIYIHSHKHTHKNALPLARQSLSQTSTTTHSLTPTPPYTKRCTHSHINVHTHIYYPTQHCIIETSWLL